jgi:hypothetical protein
VCARWVLHARRPSETARRTQIKTKLRRRIVPVGPQSADVNTAASTLGERITSEDRMFKETGLALQPD